MIKYENTKKHTKLEAGGDITEITSDIIHLIKLVHDKLVDAGSEEVAEAFKEVITEHVDLAFMTTDEIDEKTEEAKKERDCSKKELDKSAKKLADSVRDLDADELDELFKKGEK